MTERFGINLGENYESVIKGTPSQGDESHKEPQPSIEAEPIGGKTREERIAAFKAYTEDLEEKRKEVGWERPQKQYEGSQSEYLDRIAAEEYNFEIEKINNAIEKVERTGRPLYEGVNKEESFARLKRAKVLIEKEIAVSPKADEPRPDGRGIEPSLEPLAEKKEEGIIKPSPKISMSKEGAPAPSEPEKKSEPTPKKPKEKQYTEKDSVEGWEHYIAKEEERMRREKPLTPQGEAMGAFIKRQETQKQNAAPTPETKEEIAKESVLTEEELKFVEEAKNPYNYMAMSSEEKEKLYQLQGRLREAKEKEQNQQELNIKIEQKEESKTETKEESPEIRQAVDELLGEELGRDAQMREAAAAVVEARRAMREALATRKEERLYAEAGAGFIAPEKLQEAERIEKTYEDALVGLSARLRESAGNNEEAFLAPYVNIHNAEAMRVAQMREAALTPERGRTVKLLHRVLNNPFNSDVPPRYARYVRVGLTAAALGGGAAILGGMGAAGIAAYAGWRISKSLAFAFANGIARSSIDIGLTRYADTMMEKEQGRQRTTIREALKNIERIEALQELMRASIRGFQSEAAAQLENRKFYGRAATFGLMGLSGLISYELARPSAVAADEGVFGGHVVTNEDIWRKRFYETTGNIKEWGEEQVSGVAARAKELYNSGLPYGESLAKSAEEAAAKAERYMFGGKPSAEVIEDVIGKGGAGGASEAAGETAPPSGGGGITPPWHEEASMRPGGPSTPEEIPPAGDKGELPPHIRWEVEKGGFPGVGVTPPEGGGAHAAEILTDEQREEALKQYYGLVESAEKDRIVYLEKSLRYAPSDEWREEALKQYYGLAPAEGEGPRVFMTEDQYKQLRVLQEKGVLSDEQIETLKRNWGGGPKLLTPEELERLKDLQEKGVLSQEQIDNLRKTWEGKLEAAAKESIAVIGKDGNIWEASRSLIGEGEGKISKEQWLEAWEKSGLADKGFVKPGATIRFDAAEGLLKVSEAKDNEFLYQALVAEGKIKVGEPIPPEYQWLEKARGIEHHAPSPGEQATHAAALTESRSAITKETLEEIMRERAAGGVTLKEFFADHEAYMKDFADDSLANQEAKIADIERGFYHLSRANELEITLRPEVREELLGLQKQSGILLEDLQKHPAYLEHVKAWEALEKEWGRKVGVSEAQFRELGNKWSVERFLDTAKKIENRDFVPSDHLSKILEARRMGTLEMAEKIQSKLPDSRALKMPLGRFLKNTL